MIKFSRFIRNKWIWLLLIILLLITVLRFKNQSDYEFDRNVGLLDSIKKYKELNIILKEEKEIFLLENE